jgi:hypothetical protein
VIPLALISTTKLGKVKTSLDFPAKLDETGLSGPDFLRRPTSLSPSKLSVDCPEEALWAGM